MKDLFQMITDAMTYARNVGLLGDDPMAEATGLLVAVVIGAAIVGHHKSANDRGR